MHGLRWAIGLTWLVSMVATGTARVTAAQSSVQVLGWSPGVAQAVPLESALVVYFNRPMDRTSLDRSFRLVPSVPGRVTAGTSSVTFHPSTQLRPSTTYRLSIRGASSADGLVAPVFSARFTTGELLRILRVTPGAGTQEVPITGLISVSFNHPMVPLGGVSGETTMPRGWHLSLHPSVAGYGSWLGTSTWVFHPSGLLQPATRYTVTVSRSARDSSGETLGKNVRWHFRTAVPELYSRSPRNGSQYVSPRTDIQVTFSQPMDHASTVRALRVTSHGIAVSGSVRWSGATLFFHPNPPLTGGATYRVSVGNAAESANRQAHLTSAAHWSFDVAPAPVVSYFRPSKLHTAWAHPPMPYYFQGPCCGLGPYSVSIVFNTPMSKVSLDRHLHIVPSVDQFTTSLGGDSNGEFSYTISGDFKPSSAYSITVDPGVTDAFGRPLPGSITYPFKTSLSYPSVALYGMPNSSMMAFTSGQVVRAPLQTLNVPRVHFQLVKTSLYALQQDNCNGCVPTGKTIRRWSEATGGALNQIANPGVEVKTSAGGPLAPGLYWLGAWAPESIPGWGTGPTVQNRPPSSSTAFLVNDVSMTVKAGSNGTLVWVDDANTGKPLQGVSVHLIDYNGATIATATTGADGLHFFSGYRQNGPQPVFGAQVNDGRHVGLAVLYWQANTTSPSYYSWPWQNNGATSNGTYLYTDRAVYRPGQTVHFRAVLWRDRDAVYSLPAGRSVNVTATDSRGKQIFNRRLTLDRFGSISGTLRIPSGAPTGSLNLWAGLHNGPAVYTSATVADYRKPEFLTSVTAVSPRYAQGQTATVKVSVQYVFGGPVANQKVQWTAYSTPAIQSPPGWDAYNFVDWEQYWTDWWQIQSPQYGQSGALGSPIDTGTGKTDAGGTLTIRMPVDLAKVRLDRTVVVEVTATDRNAQSVSGRTSLQEFHSDLAIGLQSDQQVVNVGSPATIAIVSVHQSGAAAPGTTLTATIARRTYTSTLIVANGTTEWQQVPSDTPVSTQTLTTDASGKATLTFIPATGGEYFVTVSGRDQFGNATSTSVSIDASAGGATDWSNAENTSITLKPDRTQYSAGQTAHILVPSPFADPTVLVTVERGSIRKYWVTSFSGTTGTVDVPLGIDALPDEFVTVTLYHGRRGSTPPEWRTGTAELRLRLDPRLIHVQLSQPSGSRHPGQRVTYTVRTTTASGKPVSAEVSLALVDTAVLALMNQSNADILQALYSERPLGVTTGSEGAISIDNLTQRADFVVPPPQGPVRAVPAPILAKAGGGGGGYGLGASVNAPASYDAAGRVATVPGVTLRTRFADTAMWRGSVVTGSNGTASISVTLPDNTTTWKLDARSVSASQSVGGATLTTLATRDLVLRPVLPRFFVQGDRIRVGVALNNRLDRPETARVTMSASGLRLASRPQTVTVPARGERLLLFPARVPVSTAAVLTARAIPADAGVEGDAVQVAVPVHAPLTDETTATTGQVYSSTRQLVVVPRNAVAVPGALTVMVQSSITAGLGEAYRDLMPQPYESNDDVAARVLAAASLSRLPQPITGLSPKQYRHLSLDIALGVQKLLDAEWYDQGWPWFTDFGYQIQSDPYVTADVVQALAASGRHGRDVRDAVRNGQNFLVNHLRSVSAQERAHMLAVLAETHAQSGQVRVVAEALYHDSIRRLHLDAGALADEGSALGALGDIRKARTIVSTLQSEAQVSATGAHWEAGGEGYLGGPPIDNTDRVLRALLAFSPHDPLEPAAARWVMLARQSAGWDCNRDTAQSIAALSLYALAAREGTADYHYSVVTPVAASLHGWYTPSSHTFSSRMSVAVSALHRRGPTRVDISRSAAGGSFGTGPLYYLARLHYYLPANDIAPLDEGVSVSRRFLDLAGHPIASVKAGSAVKVQLTIRTGQSLVDVVVRDPLCSGCEPIDESLNTSRQGIAVQPSWNPWQRATAPQDLTWYLIHSDLEDDHVSLYAYYLPPGTYRYTYLVQATVAGTYDVPPTHVSEQFFPEVFGRSGGQVFVVR